MERRICYLVFYVSGKKHEERAGFEVKSEQFARRVSSSTIDDARNRLWTGVLIPIVGNSGSQCGAYLMQNLHQPTWKTAKIGSQSGRSDDRAKLAQHLMDRCDSPPLDKNGKLVKDYMGETDTKQVVCSFLREESHTVAPPKGEKAGKELLCPMK